MRCRACGICGSDLHLLDHREDDARVFERLGIEVADPRADLVLGHEFVAEVLEYGPNTLETVAVGSRVCSVPFLLDGATPRAIGATPGIYGGFAEHFLLDSSNLLAVPDGMPDEAAALVEPFAVAVHAVNMAQVSADDAALVVGCGPIGIAIISVLRQRGLTVVVASDLLESRQQLARGFGATEVHDARTGTVLPAAAHEHSAPVVFDCTGATGMIGRIMSEAPRLARIVCVGISSRDEPVNPLIGVVKELSLRFALYYTPDEFAESLRLLSNNEVTWQGLVTSTITLEDLPETFERMRAPSDATPLTPGKIVVSFPGGAS